MTLLICFAILALCVLEFVLADCLYKKLHSEIVAMAAEEVE